MATLGACSPNKNTAATRKYQAFITRYNIYYNGDKHFNETLNSMEDKYEDDYSGLVLMHPVEAKNEKTLPQPSGNFDRSIEKAQKAIQLRSITKKPKRKSGKGNDAAYKEWLKREEYNPFIHNAWMMMGRSQYYNGDFLGAASTFFYTQRHFFWLPDLVTEAKLWQARSYISLGWLFEGEVIINRIKPDELTNKTLKGLYYSTFADLRVKEGDYAAAIPYLREAIGYESGAQRTRLWFLLGQLYSRTDQKAEAYKAFAKAGSSNSASYRTKFNARIKQSEVFAGNDITPEVKALRRMTRYDRNKEYLDQIYYAIGNLYLSRQDTAKAIENYELAVEKSTRSGIDKAMCQLTLGQLYFERHNYEKAQPCYAEAVPLLPENYPDYRTLKRRSDVLDELAVYSQNVNLQDSLLRLAAMPEAERDKVIDKIISDLKKKEKEEAENAKREEYLAQQNAQGSPLKGNNAPNTFNINTDDSWYFYNTATRNAGKTEFQRRWGSRKLEDNWRRRNKAEFNFDDFNSDSADEAADEEPSDETTDTGGDEEMTQEEKQAAERAADPHYPEYYLAQIPFTDEQKATSHEVIQEGLYNMGVILKDKLEDFDAALDEFNRLLADYPDNVYRLDTYYNLYLMFMRQGLTSQAERYRLLILSDFADSPYGQAMQNPNYLDDLRQMDAKQEALYEQTFDDYLANRNEAVHEAYEDINSTYPMSPILHKFMLLNALAYATEKRTDDFNSTLRELLERYPDTDITPIAAAWLKGMAQGRELQTDAGAGNMRGMIWDMRLGGDSIASASQEPAVFDLDPESKQLLVMTFDTDLVPSNLLLYQIAKHNFQSFVTQDFDLEQMNFGRLGLIVIKGFENLDHLNHYRRVMASAPDFKLLPGVRPVVISEDNFKKLIAEGRSFEEYFRYLDEQNYIDAQANLIPVEDIETLEEAEERQTEYVAPSDNEEAETPEDEAIELTEAEEVIEPETPETPETPKAEPEPAKPEPIKPEHIKPEPIKPEPKKPEPKKPEPKKPEPKKEQKPTLPTYDPGSEGDDDPLLLP